MNPSGGTGALSAVHDAVALANWLCSLQSTSPRTLARVFKEYHAERHPIAKQNLLNSQMLCALGGKVKKKAKAKSKNKAAENGIRAN